MLYFVLQYLFIALPSRQEKNTQDKVKGLHIGARYWIKKVDQYTEKGEMWDTNDKIYVSHHLITYLM